MCIKEFGEKIREVASNLLLEPQTSEETWRLAIEKSRSEAKPEPDNDKLKEARVIDQP